MKYEILGQLKSGKNHMIITRKGHRFPLPAWAKWRDEVVKMLLAHKSTMIEDRCRADIEYWKGDLRRRDVPGMADAVWHCLERALIVKDDSLIVEVVWKDMGLDRENPRATLELVKL